MLTRSHHVADCSSMHLLYRVMFVLCTPAHGHAPRGNELCVCCILQVRVISGAPFSARIPLCENLLCISFQLIVFCSALLSILWAHLESQTSSPRELNEATNSTCIYVLDKYVLIKIPHKKHISKDSLKTLNLFCNVSYHGTQRRLR